MNRLLAPEQGAAGEASIGILDIFGFENFDFNSLEQFCINLANENLQSFFNRHIFQQELMEYEKEGIGKRDNMRFTDNADLLQLIVGRPIGLLAILDEESRLQSSTDESLKVKLQQSLAAKGSLFQGKPNGFCISHYAGRVIYDVADMIAKNRDPLPELVTSVLANSRTSLIRSLFSDDDDPNNSSSSSNTNNNNNSRASTPGFSFRIKNAMSFRNKSKRGASPLPAAGRAGRNGGGGGGGGGGGVNGGGSAGPSKAGSKAPTVSSQFYTSLQELIAKMDPRSPHFVRCLKPNAQSAPNYYYPDFVMNQLRYTGMLETVRIRREGYAYRPTFAEFIKRFGQLGFPLGKKVDATSSNCKTVLKKSGLTDWEVGKTKVFLRYWHEDTLTAQVSGLSRAAVIIQRFMRGLVCRKKYARVRAQYRLEQRAVSDFLRDLRAVGARITNSLFNICDEDAYRAKDKLRYGVDKVSSDLFADQPLPPPGADNPKLFKKSMKKLRDQSVDWFKKQELPRGMVFEDGGSASGAGAGAGANSGTDGAGAGSGDAGNELKKAQDAEIAKWFHGLLSRTKAEELLYGYATGTFLIRVSEARAGYALSLVFSGRFKHYKILQTQTQHYKVVGTLKEHESLHDLVRHYQENPLSSDGDRLVFPLGQNQVRPALPEPGKADDDQLTYAELLWDKSQIKAAIDAKEKRDKEKQRKQSETPSEFIKVVAPMLVKDKLGALNNETLMEMEDRYGARQLPEDSPFRYSVLDESGDAVPEDEEVIVTASGRRQIRPAGEARREKPPPVPMRHLSHPEMRPDSIISEGEQRRREAILADAERRILEARHDWEKNKKKKKVKKTKQEKEEKARKKKEEKAAAKKGAGGHSWLFKSVKEKKNKKENSNGNGNNNNMNNNLNNNNNNNNNNNKKSKKNRVEVWPVTDIAQVGAGGAAGGGGYNGHEPLSDAYIEMDELQRRR